MSSTTASVAPSWETQKENAAPLQRGRNVASFGLRQSDTDKQDLNKRVQHYEALVNPSEDPKVTQVDSDSDPLAHWLSYIKFYQNSFPSDTRENFLIIERCVRALAKMKKYNNDDRFVSICAKYADKTKDPGQVFRYLHTQKIGVHTALFWIAWAFVAEKESDFPFAEQIFKKGLSKKAKPLQMLKLRHQQFQRRMSRHWLNSSKTTNDELNDEYDTEEQNMSSRSTLRGISTDGLHRNDRSQNRVRQGSSFNPMRRQNNSSSRRFGANQNKNNNSSSIKPKDSFSIFVEEEGENAYNLDKEYAENDRAIIAREADRRKENLSTAERWNERGGIQHSQKAKVSAPRSRTPLPAFSVFVDEECAAENERQEQQQEAHVDRQRQVRDERTFRERDSEGMAEKIIRDPVQFLKDPNRYKSENVLERQKSKDLTTEKATAQRKSRAGFNKRLLKNRNGEEQCFEEARAKAGAYKKLIGSSMNFNELENAIHPNQSSTMSIDNDGGTCMDMSMSESVSGSTQSSTGRKNIFGNRHFESETSGNKFFQHSGGSFDAGLNQTAISNASSTINDIDIACVGLPGKQEEETINTKFAMRELSMMFSSPAFEIDNARRRNDRSNASRIDESEAYVGNPNASFGNVGDGLLLDNSICNTASETNHDGRNLLTECTSYEESKNDNKGSKNSNAGFAIFQDDASHGDDKNQDDAPSGSGFKIYNEGNGDSSERITEQSSRNIMQLSIPFQIYDEGNEENNEETTKSVLENGDTANIADAIALLDGKIEINEMDSSSDEESECIASEGDETANLSLFNEIFQSESDKQEADVSTTNDGESRRNPERSLTQKKVTQCTTASTNTKKRLKRSYDDVEKAEFDYKMCVAQNIKSALTHLQTKPDLPDYDKPSLSRLLSGRKVFHFPSVALPKQLRRKHLISNTEVLFGRHGGLFVKKELGRGTFGRVFLVNTSDSCNKRTVAVKVQSPTDSLAWEFVVLQRLEKRILLNRKQAVDYNFPRPINFISLADGGILNMSAVSETGLNLVDLSNFYTLKLGKPVPELIAFHYTSVALRIIEQLHWRGKILHCDVKPDNFVLSNSNCSNTILDDIDFSDLTLVDFGNAVDLTQNSDLNAVNTRNILFHGSAARKDMRCGAMRSGQSWSYDADTFGILCCAHVLLYGNHLDIKKGSSDRWVPSTTFKRYWKKDLWKEIFDTLLNLDDVTGLSISSQRTSLRALRQKIDVHLKTEAKNLHQLLSRQANILPDSREKIQ